MLLKEFGNTRGPVALFLHGGGLSWWSLRDAVRPLEAGYRVVLAVLDGHGEDAQTPFVSISDAADNLLGLIDERYGGSVFALYGLSLGGQIALEMLSRRPELAERAVIESAPTRPLPAAEKNVVPAVRLSCFLIKRRWFARLQARALRIPDALFGAYFEDSARMSRSSLINVLRANAAFAPAEVDLHGITARVLVLCAEKDPRAVRACADALQKALPNAERATLIGARHGETALCHPDRLAAVLAWFFA